MTTNCAIHKFPLKNEHDQEIELAPGAEILTVQMQHGHPMLWAIVDLDAPIHTKRKVRILGTGWRFDGSTVGKYIATFQLSGGALVFHVFDQGE